MTADMRRTLAGDKDADDSDPGIAESRGDLLRRVLVHSGRLRCGAREMRLIRANQSNFAELETDWGAQTERFGEDFSEFATPYIDHARAKANHTLSTGRYGLYLLVSEDGYEALAHLNVAGLPGTTGKTLRVLWVLLAPKYDYGDFPPETLAEIATAIIWESVRLASEVESLVMANHVKIHLNNLAERAYFVMVAHVLGGFPHLQDVAVRGNWLHMSLR